MFKLNVKVKVKVTVISDMSMQVQRGCGSIALTHLHSRRGDHIPPPVKVNIQQSYYRP
jgi:hypothetical protein